MFKFSNPDNSDVNVNNGADNSDENVNIWAEFIVNKYHELIDKYMPRRKFTKKQKRFFQKPWITYEGYEK